MILFGAFVVACAFGLGYGIGFDRGRAWRSPLRRPVLRDAPDGLPVLEWTEPS